MRYLVCIASDDSLGLPQGPRFKMTAMRQKFEVMEGVTGMTPFEMQLTHVTQETAESLVKKYPGAWQIIDARELEELERMWND